MVTPQQARQELARRELAKRQAISSGASGTWEADYSKKIIPQFITGLAESLPFGKTVTRGGTKLPSGIPLEEFPRPQGFLPSFARGLGEVAPDLAMSSPFMRGAGLIPKIPQIARAAIGFGAYGGTKAAIQGEPIIPSALSSAGSAALFHGAGRVGATALQKLPFGERVGSAIGGGIVGKLIGGEEGMALGTGLGGLYPATKIGPTEYSTRLAKNLINYRLKPSKSLKKYADPAEGIVKEGLWGRNIADLESRIDIRLNQLNDFKDNLKQDARNLNVTVNLAKNKTFQPIHDVLLELQKAPESHKGLINQIMLHLTDIFTKQGKFRKLNNLTIDDAYEIRNIVNGLKPNLWKGSTVGEVKLGNALRESYYKINEAINDSGVSPELKLANKRISNLIAAKNAVTDASKANPSYWRLLPLPIMLGGMASGAMGGPAGIALGLGTLAGETVPGSTLIGKMISQKYPKIK